MFVTNGFAGQVIVGHDANGMPIYGFVNMYNINVNSIRISNNDGVIAEAYFGPMEGARIGPGQHILWLFSFPPHTVFIQNADLSFLSTQATHSYSS